MFGFRVAAGSLVLLAALTACGGQASSPAPTPQTPSSTSTATPPPSGTSAAAVPQQLEFTAKTVDGKDFRGAELAGKPAVLWFWAPWCPKCQREAPGMAAAAKEHGAKVTFLGVAALDQVPAMQQFVQKYGLQSFQHLADVDSAVWKRFGVTAQPAYAFIDAAGQVEVVTTQLSEQDLKQRLSKLA
ncbi:redoxin domain-containing protein [Lentzea flava]|uniref:Thiol:disulfide interchange protein n=1 Tax=Lentzea flava TaxID=103732 RepID=A0ABQ2VF01_9PSEU|nr:redoxin domain-containing protein [Lentzea flava]MCP2205094.1 Thiol-disulfide isomerase or thioredoxin [Lentzea flava]GGU83648.1 thiol:disulfide interchange protein [Lentzea flava]